MMEAGIPKARMIIYHIHNDGNTCLMECGYHFFKFPDTDFAMIWVGRIRPFRNIIIKRIITPIKCIAITFIYRTIIKRMQQVNMGNAEFFQIIYARWMYTVAV